MWQEGRIGAGELVEDLHIIANIIAKIEAERGGLGLSVDF